MKKYKCSVCGHVYDPQKGDPQGNIDPDTSFEELPDDWKCPICGVEKSYYNPLD